MTFSGLWSMKGDFDIIHIHFPGYITYEIEACLATGLTDRVTAALEERLEYWKSQASIVVTRHSFLPHRRRDSGFRELYTLVYRYADAVVHLADTSRGEYCLRYGDIFTTIKEQEARGGPLAVRRQLHHWSSTLAFPH